MPDIYDLDTDQQVVELLPPDKRFTITVSWLQAVLKSSVHWLRDNTLTRYRQGSADPQYVPGTYAYGAYVKFQKAVYVSLIANNTDNPTVTTSWYQVQNNFIGINERILYNGQRIILEYALNKWFGTIFRQPGSIRSDIYLVTNPQPVSNFLIGYSYRNSSYFYKNRSTEYIINDYSFNRIANLTINVPFGTYNSLEENNTNRDNVIRSFVDQYIAAGITYSINPY